MFLYQDATRSAKGSGSDVHLIHREAVPLPLEGKDLMPLKVGETCKVGHSRLSQTSSTANAVPLLLQGEGLKPLREWERTTPVQQHLARRIFEVSRPTLQVKPILSLAIVLPLEGKGDRSAVDEVNIRPAPLREAMRAEKESAR